MRTPVYDLKAVNPNRKAVVDKRTPNELLYIIEAKGGEVAEALAALRSPEIWVGMKDRREKREARKPGNKIPVPEP